MPKPEYPTKAGLWADGTRKETGFADVRLGRPYREAVENFQKAMADRKDFDPAALFVWGTMQASAVLNILKAAEETFGPEGQEMVRRAVNQAGYEAMDGMLRDSNFPDEAEETELISYIVTGLNTVLYASLEDPRITSEDSCEFDILWCPHQDRYTAFDCRVQRYFVEGMFKAMNDHGYGGYTAEVTQLIPRGADRCHFVVDRINEADDKHPWFSYSEEIGRKAFKMIEEND